jgi:acyl carrier protein
MTPEEAAMEHRSTEREVRQRVRDLVVEAAPLSPGEATGDSTLTGELGYDSLALLELMNLLEAEFDLPEVDEDLSAVVSLRDAEDMVLRFLAAQGRRVGA